MSVPLIYPKPQPDQKRYKKILEEGFRKYPERYENFQKYTKAIKGNTVNYLPVKLDVENVSRCNLQCDMCQVASFPNYKRARDMTFEEFKNMVDEQCGLVEIKIQGMGEPFLGKDFIQMVEYASGKSIWTRTSTNATLLQVNENYKRIIDADIGELQISVDGTTKETYEKIRQKANFNRMVENCKKINQYCEKRGIDKTRMWVLLQKENLKDIYRFPGFAKELEFKRVAVILDVNGWGDKNWTCKNKDKKVSSCITQAEVDDTLEQAEKCGIQMGFWDISSKYSVKNPCPWPFERAYISSDMKVVPCCMIANPDTFHLGTLGSFREIWEGLSYQQFRESHVTGKIPEVCRYCY
ncbi:MAG: radical SAM protein [Candidatus Brocadiaceae bacterium]|nr:radical SAM protein [Candidatus Brocadiaceae bacterium]